VDGPPGSCTPVGIPGGAWLPTWLPCDRRGVFARGQARRFLTACVDADMPETTRLAATIERWRPQIEAFLALG
jgi:hypothetical protein